MMLKPALRPPLRAPMRGATTLREGGGVPAWVLAGAALDLDMAGERGYNSMSPSLTSLNDILTYTAPSPKLVTGADGVLRYAPHNLLTGSQTIGGSGWLNSGVPPLSVTQNAAIAPSGTTTAALISLNTSGGTYQLSDVPTDQRYSATIWLKRVSTSGTVRIGNPQTPDGGRMVVDLALLGDDWEKIIPTHPAVSDYREFTGRISKGGIYLESRGTAVSFYAWGAQNNLGATLLTYLPTTTAAVYSLPIDHDPITFDPLGVLIEEQRTNLLTYSEDTSVAGWAVSNTTKGNNTATAPDATTTADKIIETNTPTVNHYDAQAATTTAAVHTFSRYLKSDGRTFALMYHPETTSGLVFDLSLGVTAGRGTSPNLASGGIQNIGDGWYRCWIVVTATAALNNFRTYLATDSATTTYTGDGTSGIFAWGAQLEAGAFPTSYIPTVASQVTRAADQVSILTSAFGYNALEGTLLGEASWIPGSAVNPNSAFVAALSEGVSSQERIILYNIGGEAGYVIQDGGVVQAQYNSPDAIPPGVFAKLAVAYKENDTNGAVDGVASSTDTACTMPVITKLTVGASQSPLVATLNGHIKRLTYFPTRRTNADLVVLST